MRLAFKKVSHVFVEYKRGSCLCGLVSKTLSFKYLDFTYFSQISLIC